ncbi:MAG: S8 family serine peptidase, partial [Halobacteriovoraceae bacterium]|nr:S8 family serine peptidase [Halobacteriovoraceae bacterium]
MKFILLLTIGLTLLVSCSKNNSGDAIVSSDIFSNRPQNNNDPEKGRFIAILKLETPALLTTSSVNDAGVTVIDPEEAKNLEAEQEEMIAKLTVLSKEIKVLRRYKLVLNALAVLAPKKFEGQFKNMTGISYMEKEQAFARAEVIRSESVLKADTDLNAANSTTFIGADKAHALGIKGQGIKVGILDTGIDYTHKMLGGVGTKEAYEAIDPSKDALLGYPNAKVVGGVDLVGTNYDASSPIFSQHIPLPDNNPIDEGGHGSHVAGSVAGIGDGIKTYNGVAPDATLHAIKVFGAKGSTGDMVIIAGLEYAADPNADGELEDQLDVVNLSLGSGFGKMHSLYNEAVKNLVDGGTFMVASAGNSGHNVNIVGSPSIINEAFSIGASVDDMSHNVNFGAVAFNLPNVHEPLLAELVEGNISKPISETEVVGKLVFIGDAANDLSDEQKAAVKGNVALIDRGAVSFIDKLTRAENAGAIGVVVANNRPGAAIRMGGEGKVELPAVMITQAIGNQLKTAMTAGDTVITFKTEAQMVKEELIDTLTSFSSRGPRFGDSGLKPEIAAPGFNIISAAMGKGDAAVQMSGTSMSAPHMAGVMALLVQKFPK